MVLNPDGVYASEAAGMAVEYEGVGPLAARVGGVDVSLVTRFMVALANVKVV
jgi:hypothetical protein